jgi:branched-chain amino acid transport system substrate-binding protein
MLRRAFLLSSLAVALSGCAESGGYYPSAGTGYGFGNVPVGQPESLMPMAGQPLPPGAGRGGRVAVLLPLSGPLSQVGQAMLQAAQLAAPGAPELDVKDTGGTPEGAAAAAHAAVTDGAGIILGPLTSVETAAVAPIARAANIAVLAFTNDPAQAQPGVWTLGITPVQQVRRLVAAVQARGQTQFAALLPDDQFGRAMGQALSQATNTAGLPPPDIRFHAPGMASINSAVRSMSGYAARRAGIDAKIKADKEKDTPAARQEARDLAKTPVPPPPFSVLLLADTGDALEEIAALLPYYYVDPSQVQVLGPSLWASPASGSGHMPGAWFAAPDPAARAALVQAYTEKYGTTPPQLASLAFDAASIARVLAADEGYSAGALTRPAGFLGTGGWLSLLPDGHVRRGLAVFRIGAGGPQMIEPAPQSGSGPGT